MGDSVRVGEAEVALLRVIVMLALLSESMSLRRRCGAFGGSALGRGGGRAWLWFGGVALR